MATCTFAEPGTDATQDTGLYPTIAGTVASDATVFRTGTSSLKLSTTATPANASARTAAAVVADTGSRVNVAVRISTLPAARTAVVRLLTASASTVFDVQLNTTGTLRGAPLGATAVDGTVVLAANTFYRITIAYTITNTTTFKFVVFLNGVVEITCTAGTLTNTATSILQLRVDSGAGANVNVWFDDVYADNGNDYTDTGDVRVTAKRPIANGTTNALTTQIGSGGSGYGTGHSPQVNERPSSTADGWSKTVAGVALTEEYLVEGPTVGDVNIASCPIRGVFGWVRAKSGTAETAQIVVDGTATNISLTTAYGYFTKVSPNPTAFPAGTGSDVGIITATTSTLVSLAECGIIVAVTPIAANFFLCL